MPKEFLEIQITADNSKAVAELNELGARLKTFESQIKKATDSEGLIRLQKNINDTKAKMESLNSSINPLVQNTQNLVKGSNQAGQALTNVGRVAQDLPFGFMGIQNNLNPLLESFQRLKAESGSTGGALKALGGSLIGAGGVGLALSVASSAFLLFGDKLFESKKKTEEAASAIDEYRRALLEANKEAAKSLQTVANLVAADSLQTTSLQQKQKIVEQLQGISQQYFGNLRIEKGEVTGLASAYQLYADNIFRVAEAKLASKKIEELGAKLAEVTRLSNNLNNTFMQGGKQAFINPVQSLKELEKLTSGTYFESIQNVQRITELTGKSEKQVLDYLGQKNKLRTEELQLSGQIYGNALKTARVENTIKTDLGPKESTRTEAVRAVNVKVDYRPLQEMQSVNDELKERLKLITEISNQLQRQQQQAQVKDFLTAGGVAPKKTEALAYYDTEQEAKAQMLLAAEQNRKIAIDEINAKLVEQQTLAQSIGQSFANIFQNVVTAKDPFEALGNSVKQLVIDLTAAAIKMLVIKAIMTAINPAGAAISKVGGIVGSIIGGGGFAKGGVSYGPQGGHMELLHGTEAVLTPSQMSGLVRNSMNAGAVQSMGSNGGQDMNISGEFVARGQDLVLALQRSNYSLNLRRG
jgi:hypothetical protein